MTSNEFDVVIVGAGMVGASLSIALQNTDLKVALIESQDFSMDQQPSYDDRGIALSYGSQRIFESLGLWSELATLATEIQQIHISDRGHFGVTRLSASHEKVPALGQVLLAKSLGHILNKHLQTCANLTIFSPLQVTQISQSEEAVTVSLSNAESLRCKLLVGADGQHSTVRQLLRLDTWQQDYQQTAITANVTPENPHQNRAYERFTDSGPLALLPMSENRCSLIWTVKTGEEQALLALSDNDFLAALQQRFGYRLGHFQRVGKRHHYPLGLMQTEQPIQQRVLLIGNAAHSLHPIAGQGFNLGLSDVAVLTEVLTAHATECGHASTLQHYQIWQEANQHKVIKSTDFLVTLFSNANPLLGHGRSAALALLDCMPPLKSLLARHSMGIAGKQSRFSRDSLS